MLTALAGGRVLAIIQSVRCQEFFQTLVKNLLDVHLFRNIVNVSDVRPLVGVGVDTLGHEVTQTFTVLVRGQRRVVALAGGRECYVLEIFVSTFQFIYIYIYNLSTCSIFLHKEYRFILSP